MRDSSQALERARHELEQARERDISDLTRTLLHRIRNVVGDVPYQLEKIRERSGVDSDIEQPINHINLRVRSLKALSESLRTLVDLPDVFDEYVDMGNLSEAVIQKIVGGRDVDWQLSVPIEAVWVRGSQALLEDALQSLVENACEATEGPRHDSGVYRQAGRREGRSARDRQRARHSPRYPRSHL